MKTLVDQDIFDLTGWSHRLFFGIQEKEPPARHHPWPCLPREGCKKTDMQLGISMIRCYAQGYQMSIYIERSNQKAKRKKRKRGREPGLEPPYLQGTKAHVPEGRYQTPPGIHFKLVQRPEFRLHWGFWVFDWDLRTTAPYPPLKSE